MKAILVTKDDHLVYSEVPDPVMKDDEVLVQIEYAALNRADLMQRAGDYPPPAGCPDWMGLEISGTIIRMGPQAAAHSTLQVGSKVCALLGGGGYAEYVSVKYDMVMPVPAGITMAEATAMPEAFATAYLNLFIEGHIEKDDTLLMHAGASGLASVIIPMAKAFGVHVVTSVLNEQVEAKIKHLGADYIIVQSREQTCDVLKRMLDEGHPVDVAIDCLGGADMGKCLPYLSHGARWIMIATLAGNLTQIDLKNIYVRNVRIIGSTLRSKKPSRKAEILHDLVKDVWPIVEQGRLKPTVYEILPITQAEQAQEILRKGQNVGKVVLKVRGE